MKAVFDRHPRPFAQASSQSSDYGGDFTQEEEELLGSLLTQYNSQLPAGSGAQIDVGDRIGGAEKSGVVLQSSPRSFASVETLEELVQSGAFPAEVQLTVPKKPSSSQTVKGPEAQSHQAGNGTGAGTAEAARPPSPTVAKDDEIAPLARFRARRPLSVTDLVSPAWCELQYSFSLHKHGRKRRTAAMRQGSVAHQKLEDEVHATFKVDVMTKEDAWGLRLWNVIQGARTLRDTGMTRELEVWGIINGQLVNGVIDELSYECPDFDLELEGLMSEQSSDGRRDGGQKSIEEFFSSQSLSQDGPTRSSERSRGESLNDAEKVYLTDHKTRTVRSVPKGSAFKPTAMQLMIYRKLLLNLLSEKSALDPAIIWERYNVDADAQFSDSFISQFGSPADDAVSLPDTIMTTSTQVQASGQSDQSFQTQQTEPSALSISLDDLNTLLRNHPTPRELWSRMIAELRMAIPGGLGNVLRVEYWDQAQSDQLGCKNFLYDEKTLGTYLEQTMGWWQGKREPEGVDVSDAWKCKICEFAEICDWRKNKVEEDVKKFRQRAKKT